MPCSRRIYMRAALQAVAKGIEGLVVGFDLSKIDFQARDGTRERPALTVALRCAQPIARNEQHRFMRTIISEPRSRLEHINAF